MLRRSVSFIASLSERTIVDTGVRHFRAVTASLRTPESDDSSGGQRAPSSPDLTSTALKTFENLRHDKVEKSPQVAESSPYYFHENVDVPFVSGAPEEHKSGRRARIFVPARAATQAGVNNTKLWAVELDNRERWEERLIGWCANSDPCSSIGTFMKFACKEDAIFFCERQGWEYEVEEPQLLHIKPKAYGSNFSWNKKTRVSTK